MSRYKIVKMENKLSKQDEESLKNFDGILKSHRKSIRNKWLKVALIPVSIILVSSVYFFLAKDNLEEITKDVSYQNLTPTAIIDTSQTTSLPDTVVIKPKQADEQKISKNKKSNKIVNPPKLETKQNFVKAVPFYGLDSLSKYLNFEFSKKLTTQTNGKMVVAFTITKEGKATNVRVVQGISEEVDSVIINLIEEMSPWEPARMGGKKISSILTLPINIKSKQPSQDNVQ